MVTIRGAITVEENTKDAILNATKELILSIEEFNSIDKNGVISILFSVTDDLNQVAPAKAAREVGYTRAGLMCFNEMRVENSLKRCIRLIMFYNSSMSQNEVKHIFLKGAKILRPDLIN